YFDLIKQYNIDEIDIQRSHLYNKIEKYKQFRSRRWKGNWRLSFKIIKFDEFNALNPVNYLVILERDTQ
ncbi:MAG: hypothetical protein WCJ95_21115, partial [Mariniphaga sp.]